MYDRTMSAGVELGGASGPEEWLLGLERVHDLVGRAARALMYEAEPVVDLRPAARGLERALEQVYIAFDHRADPLIAAETAVAELSTVASTLGGSAPLDPAIGKAERFINAARSELSSTMELIARRTMQPRPPPPEQRASVLGPVLHDVTRASLVPHVKVPDPEAPPPEPPPPLEKPKSLQDLEKMVAEVKRRAEERKRKRLARIEAAKKAKQPKPKGGAGDPPEPQAPPGFADEIPEATSEDAFVAQRTREMFEELVLVGSQRTPLLGEAWRTSSVLEKRLFHALDAIYLFATPRIYRKKAEVFVGDLFDEFLDSYVRSLYGLCRHIESMPLDRKIGIYVPSTVFIAERPDGLVEYAMAKAAAEVLIEDINRSFKRVSILSTRLPRLSTDQTSSVLKLSTGDNLNALLPVVRAMVK